VERLSVPRRRQSPVERLRKREQFLICYRRGTRYTSPNFIYYIRPRAHDGTGVHLGTTVTKKVGKAVLRTRLKRLIKEVFRLNKDHMQQDDVDIVVVAKKNINGKSMNYQLAERELMRTVSRTLRELRE
jgi:ribonuclease P protein component